jgi:hypothetical protein
MKLGIPILVLIHIPSTNAICFLCERGLQELKRPHYFIDNRGTTCTKKTMDIFTYDDSGPACTEAILQYRETCCGDYEPIPVAQIPTAAPASLVEHSGPYPRCDICRNEVYPANPGMVINVLYLGEGSCDQYFIVGREGSIVPPHLCDALQVSQISSGVQVVLW